jgi:Protein of unknown function (DUF3105)
VRKFEQKSAPRNARTTGATHLKSNAVRSTAPRTALVFAALTLMPLAFLASGACGGSLSIATANGDAQAVLDAGSRIDGPITIPGPCAINVDAPPFLPALHVAIGTHVQYDSNPPSSGPHYPVWAAFQTWATPLQREYYVHDMEHGAVVLLYKCDADGGCPDVVAGLEAVRAALPDDPLCDKSVRVRVVITPDPLLDVPIAAAAWGWTYKAQCLDAPSLTQFAKDHYGQGPEQLCANGATSL